MLYVIIDEDCQPAKHLSKGTLAVFKDLKKLKKHSWRYMKSDQSYKIALLEIDNIFDFEKEEVK